MNMTFTFTLWELGYIIIGLLLIILLLYCISCVKNVIPLLKTSRKILNDVNIVSDIAATKTQEVEGAVSDITEAVGIIASAIKGNQSKTAALSSLVNAITSLKNLMSENKKDSSK